MAIINILKFIYTYYRTYILFAIASTTAILCYRQHMRQRKCKIGTIRKACLVFLIFAFCAAFVYCINKYPDTSDASRQTKIVLYCMKALTVIPVSFVWTKLCIIAASKINIGTALRDKILENRYGILTFILLCMHFVYNLEGSINGWAAPMYVMHYGLGFISRGFIGSLLHIISPNFLSARLVSWFLKISLIAIIILVSFTINVAIKKSRYNKGLIYLAMLYLCSPGSAAGLWISDDYGRLETYVLLVMLLAVIAFIYLRQHLYLKYIAVTFLSVIGVAIYQGGIFLYYPIVLLMVVCDCFANMKDRKRWYTAALSLFITSAAFLALQFASNVNFDSYEALSEYVRSHTDLNVDTGALEYEYFGNIVQSWYSMMPIWAFSQNHIRERSFIFVCIQMPAVILFIALWMKMLMHNGDKGREKKIYIFALLIYLTFVPEFALNADWSRWLIAVVFYSFFAVMYLYYLGFNNAVVAINRLSAFVEAHKTIAAGVLIYMASLNKIGGWAVIIPETSNVLDIINRVLAIIRGML